jgi:hypothetical protein
MRAAITAIAKKNPTFFHSCYGHYLISFVPKNGGQGDTIFAYFPLLVQSL